MNARRSALPASKSDIDGLSVERGATIERELDVTYRNCVPRCPRLGARPGLSVSASPTWETAPTTSKPEWE